MSGRADLTRWNRAGLTRFRYVDGNSATFLEDLRLALLVRYIDADRLKTPHADVGRWKDLWRNGTTADPDLASELARYEDALAWKELWQSPPAAAESAAQRLQRLIDQYLRERGDWGWEIARALARACHVLTEHLNAYANESYVGTATQWENVRRLVAMLDYHPAPPASASTPLSIVAKGEAGFLDRGFQVQYSLPEGGAPMVFETLEDLEMDPVANALRPAGWDRSPETFPRPTAPPARSVEKLRAIAIQGVGEVNAQRLDDYKRAVSGHAAAFFTLADFRSLDLAKAPANMSPIQLREFKSKAEEVLGSSWCAGLLAPVLDLPLLQVADTSAADLAGLIGRPPTESEEFRRALRRVQIALDEPAFAALRLRDLVGQAPPVRVSPWIAPENSGISAGQVGVIVRASETVEAAVVVVNEVDLATATITFEDPPSQPDWRRWTKGEASLHVKPAFVERPRLNGARVVAFEEAHDLSAAEVVAWQDSGQWNFGTVAEADDRAVRLKGGGLPPQTAEVFRALEIERGEAGLLFPYAYRAAASPPDLTPLLDSDSDVIEPPPAGEQVPGAKFRRLKTAQAMSIFLVPQGVPAVGRVASLCPSECAFDGKPGRLCSGQWVVADDDARLWPLRIARITEAEDHYTLRFGLAGPPVPPVASLPVERIQGVGAEHSTALAENGITTVEALARPEALARGVAISRVWLWEFVTKARAVLGFRGDPGVFIPILDHTLSTIIETGDKALAQDVSLPEATVAELKEELRWIEACIDEPTFRALKLRDLVPEVPSRVVRVYGLFQHTLRPDGYDRNPTPLAGSRIGLELEDLPRVLGRGRRLLIEKEDRDRVRTGAFEARVVALHPQARAIDVDPPVPAGGGFTVGNTVLSGNVVPAGHGDARPEKTLGSGDATRSGQSFVLKEKGVSFVADPSQPSGVRADVEVKIEGRTWQQVANLRDSGSADPHYAVRLTEEGYLEIQFGDGRRGRRLPTGGNNVRVRFRVGAGLAGNLAAGKLTKPAKPHRRVDAVRQPLAAAGGNEMEPLQSLRDNAPASVLTLERAVSLADFGLLAARQASVWQARAFALPTRLNRHESVEVVVVPAGGGTLGDLGANLRRYLKAHALPGVEIQVSEAQMVAVHLAIIARIKSAEYEPEVVLEAVKAAVLDAFSLHRRRLGQDLFLSEVYQVVEKVKGVENSLCVLDGDAILRRKEASERQVLYLDPALSALTIKHEEFRL